MCTSSTRRATRPGPIGPVPVRLNDVRFRYPGAGHDALRPVSLTIDAGEHVAITGANGSGKTTLMLLLAGREPDRGHHRAPRRGGPRASSAAPPWSCSTPKVRCWAPASPTTWCGVCRREPNIDVDRLLAEVGLDGLAERDTGGLSGGELQRLAVAAALAREPALLIADEVTSMVDQQGRDALISVLSGLTERTRRAGAHHALQRRGRLRRPDRSTSATRRTTSTWSRPSLRRRRRRPHAARGGAVLRARRRRPRIRQRHAVGQDRAARHRLRRRTRATAC